MAWDTSDIPNLNGRVAVVTGANSGLGFESARALAHAGATVVMAARSAEKAESAKALILAEIPAAVIEPVVMDLGSLESVRAAAAEITRTHEAIDILINNAGVMATPEGRTADGFETQFGVNHLGHWVLTSRLMPALLAADAARVVSVTSTAHHMGRRVDPENPNLEGTYSPWLAYGQSKLANYHFAIGLQREFERRGVSAQSLMAHPGLSRTNLQVRTRELGGVGNSGQFFENLAARTGMTPARGALPQLRAATDPRARGGELYAPRFVNNGPPVRRPVMRPGIDKSVSVLWEVSERLTGETLFAVAEPARA
jgi:NAD(P)-dependent dehydrogenase (short-subunit alcohol dehydrogenase family)